jgi:hypothetical protein
MSCVSPPCPVDRLSQVVIDCNKSWAGGYTAGWHLTSYAMRKLITVAGSAGGAGTNYAIKLTVHFASGIDAGTDVYLGGVVQADFDDIRFTKTDGTLLDYWVESYVASDHAIVWVEFDSIPIAPGTADFYIYYNNPTATSASNAANTFQFFDDFPGAALDPVKWPVNGVTGTGSITVAGGQVTLDSGAAGSARIRRVCTQPCVIETRAQVSSFYDPNNKTRIRYCKAATAIDIGCFDDGAHVNIQVFWNVFTGTLVPLDAWLRLKQIYTVALLTWTIETDAGAVVYTNTSALPPDPTDHHYEAGDWGGANQGRLIMDWVSVRPYVSPEPTVSAWGAEERYQIFYGITNLKELALGMTKGDLFVHNGTILARISPGAIGSELMSHDFGFMLTWEFPP